MFAYPDKFWETVLASYSHSGAGHNNLFLKVIHFIAHWRSHHLEHTLQTKKMIIYIYSHRLDSQHGVIPQDVLCLWLRWVKYHLKSILRCSNYYQVFPKGKCLGWKEGEKTCPLFYIQHVFNTKVQRKINSLVKFK